MRRTLSVTAVLGVFGLGWACWTFLGTAPSKSDESTMVQRELVTDLEVRPSRDSASAERHSEPRSVEDCEEAAAQETQDYQIGEGRKVTISGVEYIEIASANRRVLFYSPDDLYCIEFIQNGVRHGPYRTWHRNGERATVENYADGRLNGKAQYINESGVVTAEGAYKEGFKVDYWTTRYDDGQCESVGNWGVVMSGTQCAGEERIDNWIFWNPNGSRDEWRTGAYVHGVKQER